MPNPCIYCSNYKDCELENEMEYYCDDFEPEDGYSDDDYLEAIIENRRAAFRAEWFEYVAGGDECGVY